MRWRHAGLGETPRPLVVHVLQLSGDYLNALQNTEFVTLRNARPACHFFARFRSRWGLVLVCAVQKTAHHRAVWEPRASQPASQSAIFERDAACSATAHLCLRISTSLLLESTRRCTPCAPPIAVHQMCGNRSFGAKAAHLGYELVPVGTILFMRRCFRSSSSCSSCGSHRSSVAVRSCTERQNRAYSLSVMRGHQPQIGFGFNLMSTFKLILGASRHRLSRKFWKFASTHGSRCDRAPEPAS